MSRLVKGIGKIFKAVGKFVKKILPVALAIGAIFFTAGTVLALPGLGAGAAAGAAGKAGSGFLATLLKGAAKQAIQGGVISVLTGGDFKTGAKIGALTGAFGALAGPTSPLVQGFGGAQTASTSALPAGAAGAGAAVAQTGFQKLISDPTIIGNVLTGAAQGFSAAAEKKEAADIVQRRQDNFEGSGDALLNFGSAFQSTRFDEPKTQRWQYDPETKRITFS